MTESQQSQRGWFGSWREQRRAKRQARIERATFRRQQAGAAGGRHRDSSAYGHLGAATYFGGSGGYGGDGGGGCGGDGGGGGC